MVVALGGCAAAKPARITRLAGIDDSTWRTEDEELVYSLLEKVVAEEGPERREQYRREDFWQISMHRIPPQESLPSGGKILKACATQSGVAEVYRYDYAVTVYLLPGKPPAHVSEGIPSKGGCEDRYHVYDLGRPGQLLVICEGVGGQLGGSIGILLWNTRSGRVKFVDGWAGEQEGGDFCHEMRLTSRGPELVIHGLFPCKRSNPAYEEERVELAEALGISVEFIYDGPDYGDP